ncbi:hypothetical protein QBC38DRAFT_550041 [Podospora fimiseda]|uniref:Ecp2 effector protein domain-containing protein n=1 Tax=Podospora fimiseda TaxID=252190 RepID=A0AAN6YMR1_9PEZI|nr:hypothetical protein QBC38DRAFT_550041 [Podospora fimiseda]
MHILHLLFLPLTCLFGLGFTDNCSVSWQTDITGPHSPIFGDCLDVYTNFFSDGLLLSTEDPYSNYTTGTCTIKFHLGAGDIFCLDEDHMAELWLVLVSSSAFKTFGDGVNGQKFETFGDVECGTKKGIEGATNFEIYNPYVRWEKKDWVGEEEGRIAEWKIGESVCELLG